MNKIILQLTLTFFNCTLLLAQESKPIAKGFIDVTSSLKNECTNLSFEGTRVYSNKVAANSELNCFIENVNLIEDGQKKFIYEKNKNLANKIIGSRPIDTITPTKQNQKLNFVRSYKILQNQQKLSPEAIRGIISTNPLSLDQYNTGKSLVDIGNIALSAGIGFIIGGGISNLNNASNTPSNTYPSSKPRGTPIFIITGIVIGCISVPLKIIGRNNIKESIELYNQNPNTLPKTKVINLALFAKDNSFGLCFKF